MLPQLAKGPGFRIHGKSIQSKPDLQKGTTTHNADGVELTYSAQDQTIFVQGSEGQGNFETYREDIFTKVNDQRELLVSSQKDFASHVAISLSGLGGAALASSDGSIKKIKVSREDGRLTSIETERNLGKADDETHKAVGFDPEDDFGGSVFRTASEVYKPGSLRLRLDKELSQEWLTVNQPFL